MCVVLRCFLVDLSLLSYICFSCCWFCVHISARASCKVDAASSRSFLAEPGASTPLPRLSPSLSKPCRRHPTLSAPVVAGASFFRLLRQVLACGSMHKQPLPSLAPSSFRPYHWLYCVHAIYAWASTCCRASYSWLSINDSFESWIFTQNF